MSELSRESKSMAGKILKWLFLGPVLLLLLAVTFCEANKAYWDHRVDELCAKDGGVTIYEKVVISKSDYFKMKFTSTRQPILPAESDATPSDPFFYRSSAEYLYRDFLDLKVVKYKQSIIRASDGKKLNQAITYGRGGGDFPTGFHPSHHYCRNQIQDSNNYESTLIVSGDLQ